MVLVQFFLHKNNQANNNGAWHSVNINGPCSARLVSIMFVHANDAIVQIQSDIFKLPYSGQINAAVPLANPAQGVIFSNKGNLIAFDQSHKDFHWENIVIPGRVNFTLYDLVNQQVFDGIFYCALTFDIEELP